MENTVFCSYHLQFGKCANDKCQFKHKSVSQLPENPQYSHLCQNQQKCNRQVCFFEHTLETIHCSLHCYEACKFDQCPFNHEENHNIPTYSRFSRWCFNFTSRDECLKIKNGKRCFYQHLDDCQVSNKRQQRSISSVSTNYTNMYSSLTLALNNVADHYLNSYSNFSSQEVINFAYDDDLYLDQNLIEEENEKYEETTEETTSEMSNEIIDFRPYFLDKDFNGGQKKYYQLF